MSDTTEITLSNSAWTDISGGQSYGFFTNHGDQYILYREAAAQPLDIVEKGHRLQPGADKQFSLTGSQRVWARVVSTLNTPTTAIVTKGYSSLVSAGAQSHDFLCEVNQGKIPGHALVHRFGANSAVGTTQEDIWEPGGTIVWQTSAEQLSIISTDTVNDISTGGGARTILITGLDANFNIISEIITLLATPVLTVNSYLRFLGGEVVSVGTYTGTNQGDVSFTTDISGSIQGVMLAQEGIVSKTHYTIPANKTGYLIDLRITMDTNKPVVVELLNRKDADIISPPFGAVLDTQHWNSIDTPIDSRFLANHRFSEKTDFWFKGNVVSGASAAIVIGYGLLLVDN